MTLEHLDLDAESWRVLEAGELLEWLSGFAVTRPGAAKVRELRPICDANRLRRELEAVSEARRFLDDRGRLVGGGLADPRPALEALGVAGARLDAAALRDLAATLAAGADLRAELRRLAGEDFPRLRAIGDAAPDVRREAEVVLRGVEPDGRIADDASNELRRLRSARAGVAERLRRMLEGILRGPEAAPVIQDEFITQRNERYVIPVRSDSPRAVHGIVHATSSSGATRFVEPIESVELNNELVRLAELEQAEQDRLLLGWSDDLRAHLDDVRAVVDVVAGIDSLQARALFARECSAVEPGVADDGRLALLGVRHPLLDRRLREQGERCVPLDLELDPYDQVVVISGPNTGGKTVALKTLGLSVVMAQSAIPLPARDAQLPVYRQLRADIGDHQSIEADLSTFSAHVGAVAAFVDSASSPGLFLFDEIGTGTEPTEGAALAQAILEALGRPGITAVATTHHGALKAWAFTTDGVVSAAMEFDAASLRPTFRILTGAAGTSAGLEIAVRLGLDAAIVDRARRLLGAERETGERYMNRLRELTAQAEQQREELARREADLEARHLRDERSAREREEKRARQVREGLDRAVARLRDLGRRELESLRDERERRRAARELTRAEARLRREATREIDELGAGRAGADEAAWTRAESLETGQLVLVRSLGREGTVQAIHGARVEVLLGRTVFTVEREDLLEPATEGAAPRSAPSPASGPRAIESRAGTRRETRADDLEPSTVGAELKLLGMTVDEGLEVLDAYLDRAALAGHDEVRVVHGHGTGKLRRAVREFLRGHAHVRGFRPGEPGEGGDGATIVRLG